MSISIEALDKVQTEIARLLHSSAPAPHWTQLKMYCKYAPHGGVGGLDFDYGFRDGCMRKDLAPDDQALIRLYALTAQHLKLTKDLGQAGWYKMTVELDNTGRFTVHLDYKDDYKQGDILQRG